MFHAIQIPVECGRDHVVMEILTTEQTYVRSLCVLLHVFKDPIALKIEEGPWSLTEANFHTIFSNIEEIVEVNHDTNLLISFFSLSSCPSIVVFN